MLSAFPENFKFWSRKKKNKKTTTKKNTSQFGVFMKKVERKDGVRTIVGKRQESWYADLKKKKNFKI